MKHNIIIPNALQCVSRKAVHMNRSEIMAPISNITMIPLSNLLFDPENPRLPKEFRGNRDEQAIIKHMLRDESLIELMKSIGQTRYSASEPLLVVPESEKYIVVEGNRRLAALKLLSNPELAVIRRKSVDEVINEKRYSPELIPCIQYGERAEILDYLGYRHITGVKNWGALEKARYLQQLYERHIGAVGEEHIFSVLAKMIGSRRDYVAKLLTSYALYERANDKAYFGIEIDEKDVDFSLLSTALGYENIYKFIGLESSGDIKGNHVDDSNYGFLFHCLYDPAKKIHESRELKQLSNVIGNPEALAQYKAGTPLQIAAYYTSEPVETFKQLINDAYTTLKSASGSVERINPAEDELDYIENKLQDIKKLTIIIGTSLKALQHQDLE